MSTAGAPDRIAGADLRRRRWRGATAATAAAVLQIVTAAAAQFVLFGAASRSLSPDHFGVWTALATITLWLTVTDLGLNRAAVNAIAGAGGDAGRIRHISGASFLAQVLLCLALAAVLLPLEAVLPWPAIFRMNGDVAAAAAPEVRSAVLLVTAVALAGAPFASARAVLMGQQRGWIPSLWDFAGSLTGIAAGLLASRGAGLLGMTAASACAAAVPRALAGIWLLGNARPRAADWDPETVGMLWRAGRHYLLAQTCDLVFLQSQPWMAARILGSGLAGGFAAAARLVTLPSLLSLVAGNALIPAYGEARLRGDWEWIRSTVTRIVAVTALGVAALAAAFSLLLDPLLRAWLGTRVPLPPPAAQSWLIAAASVQALIPPLWSLLYGLEKPSVPARWNIVAAAAWLLAGMFAGHRWGATGLAAALCLAPALLYLAPLALAAWRVRQGAAPQ